VIYDLETWRLSFDRHITKSYITKLSFWSRQSIDCPPQML